MSCIDTQDDNESKVDNAFKIISSAFRRYVQKQDNFDELLKAQEEFVRPLVFGRLNGESVTDFKVLLHDIVVRSKTSTASSVSPDQLADEFDQLLDAAKGAVIESLKTGTLEPHGLRVSGKPFYEFAGDFLKKMQLNNLISASAIKDSLKILEELSKKKKAEEKKAREEANKLSGL